MAKPKLVESAERIRKIGDRKETITVELTPEEIDAEQCGVMDMLGRRKNLDAARKSIASEYKAKIEAVDIAIDAGTVAATTGKRQIDVDVEEWLTTARKVIRVRADNGDVLGSRTARTDELQEALFEDRSTDRAPERAAELAFPPPGEVFDQFDR